LVWRGIRDMAARRSSFGRWTKWEKYPSNRPPKRAVKAKPLKAAKKGSE